MRKIRSGIRYVAFGSLIFWVVAQESFASEARNLPLRPPPAHAGVWLDGVGLFSGFLLGGVDYAVGDQLTLGFILTHADVELSGIAAKGVGWGVRAEYFLTGRAISTGVVAGGSLLFLPTEFVDGTQSPSLTGEIFGFGAILAVGYQWVIGPFSIRPAVSLAYLDFPKSVYLTGGVTPQSRDIESIHGTVPAGHLQIGVVF